jgi:hypothetical protein
MTANVEARLNELAANQTEIEIIADVSARRLAELSGPIKRKSDAFVANSPSLHGRRSTRMVPSQLLGKQRRMQALAVL